MKKWLWAGAGTVAALALGFVLYQSLFGNNDEALEVKKQAPPVVQKAKVNKKKYEVVQFSNNRAGFTSPLLDGQYRIKLEAPKAGYSIRFVPADLLDKLPVLGTKIWVTFEIDNTTGVQKAKAASLTPPVEVPAGQVVLMGEYEGIAPVPSSAKRAYRIKYGTFDESKQVINDVLTYKAKEEEKEPKVCYEQKSTGDSCVFKLNSRIDVLLEIDEYGQASIKSLTKNAESIDLVKLYPKYFGIEPAPVDAPAAEEAKAE
jgi:hypothetical protein